VKYIHGVIPVSDRLFQQTIVDEKALMRHEDRLMHDPEYAVRWDASVDWDLIEDGYR
jgi:hypothetical protein